MRSTAKRSASALTLECLEDRSLPSSVLPLPGQEPLLAHLSPKPTLSGSTAAQNGDQNPYGVAFVQGNLGGKLHAGSVLVSDFNNATVTGPPQSGNVQGTGTSIVEISPSGKTTTFFQGKAPLGLTTALGILPGGYVLVGNVPSHTDAKGGTSVSGPGSLLVIDHNGHLVQTITNSQLLDGPWDLTINVQGSQAQVFVANVLSGTITRLDMFVSTHSKPFVTGMTQIASGYATGTDPAALIVGPTGLAYDPHDHNLFVASTKDNEIFRISDAGRRDNDDGMGAVIVSDPANLHGPLGLVIAPNSGDLIVTNGDAPSVNPPATGQQNQLLEYTPEGEFVASFRLDSGAAGAAFGIALGQTENSPNVRFAAVNDNANSVEIWNLVRS
jgi:hypothetical protein